MKTKITPKTQLSVGEVSRRSGLSISAIHFYETKGLISSQRNNGNHRRYTRGVLRKLAVIKVAQKTGIPLEEIKQAMSVLGNDKTVTAAQWTQLAQSWKQTLDDRISQLIRLRDTLGGCIGCGCLSVTDCELFNPEDIVSKKATGAYYLDPEVSLDTVDKH